MTWHTPATWTALQEVKAGDFNTEIRDLFLTLWVGSAAGDLDYYDSPTSKARLAKGTALQGLVMNGGDTAPEWQDTPQKVMTAKGDLLTTSAANTLSKIAIGNTGDVTSASSGSVVWTPVSGVTYPAKMSLSPAQAISSATTTIVGFQNVDFDAGGNCTTGASAHYTVPVTGQYQIGALAYFTNISLDYGEYASLSIYVGGVLRSTADMHYASSGSETHPFLGLHGFDVLQLTAGNQVDMRVYQNSGAIYNLATVYTYMTINRIG